VFSQLLQGISRHLPSRCAVCHSWPAEPVCEACVAAFAQPQARCRTCALPVPEGVAQCGACITHPPALDACYAAVSYGYPWSRLVADFKFHQHPAWATSLARLLRAAPWVEPALEAAHALVPMPLSAERLRARGYNQAQLLARALDAYKVEDAVLLRVRDAPAQRTLPRSERLRNVEGAYLVDPLRCDRVRNRHLLLVDDVMTSGASLTAAAKALRQAGADTVSAVVVARTE
jgi:ComF family protein